MSDYNTALGHASKGFKVADTTPVANYLFSAILPLEDTVIASITFPNTISVPGYVGDQNVVGATLIPGVAYPIYGDAITFASGKAILVRR